MFVTAVGVWTTALDGMFVTAAGTTGAVGLTTTVYGP